MQTFSQSHDPMAGYIVRSRSNVDIQVLGGRERRFRNWPVMPREWDILCNLREDTLYANLMDFWDLIGGPFEAFNWTDPQGTARVVRFLDPVFEMGPIKHGVGAARFTFAEVLGADVTPPTVSSVTPVNGGVSTGLDAPVIWVMSESILPADVVATYFHVIDSTTGGSVAGSLALSGGDTITFTPTGNYTAGRLYLPRVEAGVHDLAGNQLAAAYGSKFTAAA